ncbi:MAG: putative RDD family membrane protein YckC [Planctomycetota bacterium]|jgi:uncharacterized RDD family membrane protein YckC
MVTENESMGGAERCEDCGEKLPQGGATCGICGWRPDVEWRDPDSSGSPAGLGARLLAGMVDWVLVAVASFGVYLALYVALYVLNLQGQTPEQQDVRALQAIGVSMLLVPWLYFALLESSSLQGPIGKALVGLRVTDLAGQRITFLHASRRHFAKLATLTTFSIGMVTILFTKKKQSIHDLLVGTLVCR